MGRREMKGRPGRAPWGFGALVAGTAVVASSVAPASSGIQSPPAPHRLATVDGFQIPESVRYDPERDAYYVSNINVHATAADNNGFISILSPDGVVVNHRFVAGGEAGTTLNAPKGMALVGTDLWVTDVTVLRSFDRRTGRPGRAIDLGPHGAIFLNDLAAHPDGGLFVSDTSLVFSPEGKVTRGGTDRVYRISPTGDVSIAVADPRLQGPNGLFWDNRANQLLIASLSGKNVYGWTASTGLSVLASGPGSYDGIEALADGTIVVSSQDLPGILALHGSELRPLITGVSDTGDIGIDPKRGRIAIPRLDANVVELWQLPR